MDACTLPVTAQLSGFINKNELLGCNLNPVVVLTDFTKTLNKTGLKQSFKDSERAEVESQKRTKKSLKIKKDHILSDYSDQQQFKSLKRKRESWDPSVEYEIEKIIGYHRDKRNKMWYLVKWKNWSSEHNTFEPIDNLTGCNWEIMKFFEVQSPTSHQLKKKDSEVRQALKKRDIFKRLILRECKVGDFAEIACEYPDFGRVFELKNFEYLESRIRQEYDYVVRALIAMFSHQDPGLLLRAQNYKLLLMLIQLRRKQLENLAEVEKCINSREKTRIFIENKEDLEDFPDINYIVNMKQGEGVQMSGEPLLGCECPDGCSAKSHCCGKMSDSGFAYGSNGRLRTSERIAIYECNSRCLCPPSCPNRVVQRGRQVKLCVFKTKLCGWGVKALEKIPKGTFVCEYLGELIPDSEAVVRDVEYHQKKKLGYLFDLDFFADAALDMFCIDATTQGNVARFINHSCDPNLVVYPVWIDGLAPNIHRLAFFARRNIQKDEEIQFDYENLEEFSDRESDDGKKSHGLRMISDVRCQCNATNCRQWVFGGK